MLDENLGASIHTVLKISTFAPIGRITTLHELGYPRETGVTDLTWLTDLGKADNYVGVTRDGKILNTSIQSRAWAGSGLRLVLLRGWGNLPRQEITRSLCYWWPSIVDYAEAGAPGTAWTVPPSLPPPGAKAIKLVTGWAKPSSK